MAQHTNDRAGRPMTHGSGDGADHGFDKAYWEEHWRARQADHGSPSGSPPNPYLAAEVGGLVPGRALDAGCGAGAEAIWLATRGWQVTAADISSEALTRAARRAATSGAPERLEWVEADLSSWDPGTEFDLVTTHYAHPAMPQLEFYDRIASWVAPGGTLLIVGHLLHAHGDGAGHAHDADHGHAQPPDEASVTAEAITARLGGADWVIVTAQERERTIPGRETALHDVVVRAVRRR